jgi:ribosomal protein S12 methylthiotransferase
LFDRKDGEYFYGRTESDSPDVDNDVLVDAREHYIKIGEFIDVKIHEAGDYDLYGTPVKSIEKPLPFHQKKGVKN